MEIVILSCLLSTKKAILVFSFLVCQPLVRSPSLVFAGVAGGKARRGGGGRRVPVTPLSSFHLKKIEYEE